MTLKDANEENTFSPTAPNPWDTDAATAAPEASNPWDAPISTVKNNITFKEFYSDYCSSAIKKSINTSAIVLYLCSGITLALSVMATMLGVSIMAAALDAFILLGLALGIHIGKSRACAVIVLVYSILNCLYSLATTQRMSGLLIVLAGIYATTFTFKARKEYQEYINN